MDGVLREASAPLFTPTLSLMANIPVERTGTNWLPWLLGLLALALIGFFVFLAADDPDNDDDAVVTENVAPAVVDTDDGLDMSDLYVTQVVGDNTFFVSEEPEGGLDHLVYIEEEPTPGDATEGRYDVTDGQHISITGSMEPTPADLSPWGLTADQAGAVGDEYIRATSLTVLDGDGVTGDGMAGDGMAAGLAMLDGDLAAMAGQAIALDNVRVMAVTGDSTFVVGEGDTRTTVVLESLGESEYGPGDGSDGRFDVNEGETVSIDGTVRAFQRGMRGTSDLSDSDMSATEARRYVIVVDDADGFSK